MKLLLDLGNTRLKWVLADAAGVFADAHAHDWDNQLTGALGQAWGARPAPAAVWASSVVDAEREAVVEQVVQACWGCPVHWVRTPACGCGVHIAYARPESLGVDRFLAMVAVRARAPVPSILAHVGTTMVLDALNGQGQHLGGLIGPGPRLMRQSVLAATARVRPLASGQLVDAAANTADAVVSGSWHACAALVDRFAVRMAGKLGGHPQLLLSGGDAAALLPMLDHAGVLFPNATLAGLAVWAQATPTDE